MPTFAKCGMLDLKTDSVPVKHEDFRGSDDYNKTNDMFSLEAYQFAIQEHRRGTKSPFRGI